MMQRFCAAAAGSLFLQNNSNNIIQQVRGERVLDEREMSEWATFFSGLDRKASGPVCKSCSSLRQQKSFILHELLPDGLRLSENRPARQLEALLTSLQLNSVRLLYPFESLREAAAFDVFPRGDTHWTDFGAAVVLDALWPLLWPGKMNQRPATSAEFKMEFRNADLLSKLGGICVEVQPVAVGRAGGYRREESNNMNGTGRVQRFVSTQPSAGGHVFLAHDSFGDWLIPFLADPQRPLDKMEPECSAGVVKWRDAAHNPHRTSRALSCSAVTSCRLNY